MRIRRKTKQCLNCGHTLGEIYNFCPHCGQENNDNNVTFGTFVSEFFANYLSFDSRIGRSIKPFLLRPGFLTNQFNEGKRVRYVHPLRLYLIISVFFFFMTSLLIQRSVEEASTDLVTLQEDSTTSELRLWLQFRRVLEEESLTDQEVLDSLQRLVADTVVEETYSLDSNTVARFGFHQIRRVVQKDIDIFLSFLIQNLPVMMFLLIPLFALLLRLFYLRKRRGILYVQHLVHALHIHAFGFFVYTVLLLSYLLSTTITSVAGELNLLALLLIGVYVYLSFLNVYHQGWFKTFVKLFLIGVIIYPVLLFVFGLSEAVVSFLLF